MASKSSTTRTTTTTTTGSTSSSSNYKKRSATTTSTTTTGTGGKHNSKTTASNYKNTQSNNTTTTTSSSSSHNKKPKYSNTNDSSTKSSTTGTRSHSKQQSSSFNVVLHPRKNADIVERGKRLWNQLRCKTNTTTQIREYMNELFPLIRHKVMELTMQHDASRIVQAAIQFGNGTERQEIVQELCLVATASSSTTTTTSSKTTTTTTSSTSHKHTFLDVCQSQYAHFVILKLLKYCHKDPICLSLLIHAFKGNMMKLITHTNGSRIVEVLFQSNSTSSSTSHGSSSSNSSSTTVMIPKDKIAILKQEIYGPHYAVFAQDTLQQLVPLVQQQQQATSSPSKQGKQPSSTKEITFVTPTLALNIALLPDKKDITMDHIRNNIILKGIDKQLYGYYYFQEIMSEYVHVLMMDENYAAIRDLTSTTNITDQTIHLLSCKFGAKVVCQFIAYSTVKERKRIMKSIKGYTKSALFHKDAYLVLIRLLQCIDDTVVLYKNVLQELLSYTNASSTLSIVNSSSRTATTTKNTNVNFSISKSKEIVHSNQTDSSSPNAERPILLDIALSDTASKFLLALLIPTTTTNTTTTTTETSTSSTNATVSSYTKIFNPNEQEVLFPLRPYIMEKVSPTNHNTDRNDDDDDDITNTTTTTKNGITLQKVYTSKKDPELRRYEILQYFHIPLLQQLCCGGGTKKEEYVLELLHSIPGSNVLYQLYVATIQALTVDPNDKNKTHSLNQGTKKSNQDQLVPLLQDMMRTICLVCRNSLTISSSSSVSKKGKKRNDDTPMSIFEHVVGHRMIKNLILYDASVDAVAPVNTSKSFAEMFVQEFGSDFMSMITYNRGAFILVAMLQVTSLRQRVLDHLNVTTILQAESTVEPDDKNTSTSSKAGLHALRQEINKTL